MPQFADMDPAYFLYIGVFLGVIVLFEGLRSIAFGGSVAEQARIKRVQKMRKKRARDSAIRLLYDRENPSIFAKIPIYGTLPAKMRQAGMTMKPQVFVALWVAMAAFLFLLVTILVGPELALIITILAGLVIPMNVINIIRNKRVAAFAQQLPDALELMMRGLRVGHPLNVTITNVAENMADPIASEFQIMANQITYGDELITAITDLADRVDQEDMHYLAVSIAIQHGTGGNLAKMLGTLARVIRARFAMRRRIKAISSEGRISSVLLSALPVLIYGATSVTAPDYYSSVQSDPMFLPIASAIVLLVSANFMVLRRLVNFRV